MDLHENFITDVSVDKEELIIICKSSPSGSRSRNFFRDGASFHNLAHDTLDKLIWSPWNITTNVTLNKKSSLHFGNHPDSRSGPDSPCPLTAAEVCALRVLLLWPTVWVKKVASLTLFVVFSLLLNLYNRKFPWLMPKHISMSTPNFVHLSEYLCEMYHFYRCDASNFQNSIQFVTKLMNFS